MAVQPKNVSDPCDTCFVPMFPYISELGKKGGDISYNLASKASFKTVVIKTLEILLKLSNFSRLISDEQNDILIGPVEDEEIKDWLQSQVIEPLG